MIIGEILAAVLVVAMVAVGLTRRRSQDDVHSVDGYHRQLHTLEHINVHPSEAGRAGPADVTKPSYPESAVRVAGSPNVRLTDAPVGPVPPIAPPTVAEPGSPIAFDDAAPGPPPYGSLGRRDRAMDAMNRRPRRLAAPAIAVASVAVLIVVLLLAGSHKVTPPRTAPSTTAQRAPGHKGTRAHTHVSTTTTTVPIVSLPTATSLHSATYKVARNSFTLVVGATSGSCWVDAVDAASNATLFTAVLAPGQQHTVTVTGPVSIEVGAPSRFSGTVDGAPVILPYGFQTPFTLQLVPTAAT